MEMALVGAAPQLQSMGMELVGIELVVRAAREGKEGFSRLLVRGAHGALVAGNMRRSLVLNGMSGASGLKIMC